MAKNSLTEQPSLGQPELELRATPHVIFLTGFCSQSYDGLQHPRVIFTPQQGYCLTLSLYPWNSAWFSTPIWDRFYETVSTEFYEKKL
jgi:hypothetical protein